MAVDTARVSRKKILVVDDEKDLVDILAFNLRREQYEVLTALGCDYAQGYLLGRPGPDEPSVDSTRAHAAPVR